MIVNGSLLAVVCVEYFLVKESNVSAFGNIILELLKCADSHIPISLNSKNVGRFEIAHQILSYINDNISQDLSVDSIAKHFNMSRNNLYEIMHKRLGISPKEYIINTRIAKAVELLCTDFRPLRC